MSYFLPDFDKAPPGQWIPIDSKYIAFRWDNPTKPIKTVLCGFGYECFLPAV